MQLCALDLCLFISLCNSCNYRIDRYLRIPSSLRVLLHHFKGCAHIKVSHIYFTSNAITTFTNLPTHLCLVEILTVYVAKHVLT
uniref:Putative secreted protein n=1 Tax=Rhipicephalus microplus TaxID=6941 RepID=A0A6G5A3W4_RHIMP